MYVAESVWLVDALNKEPPLLSGSMLVLSKFADTVDMASKAMAPESRGKLQAIVASFSAATVHLFKKEGEESAAVFVNKVDTLVDQLVLFKNVKEKGNYSETNIGISTSKFEAAISQIAEATVIAYPLSTRFEEMAEDTSQKLESFKGLERKVKNWEYRGIGGLAISAALFAYDVSLAVHGIFSTASDLGSIIIAEVAGGVALLSLLLIKVAHKMHMSTEKQIKALEKKFEEDKELATISRTD